MHFLRIMLKVSHPNTQEIFMSFKNVMLNLTLGLSILLGSSMVTAPKAHAYLIVEGASGQTPDNGPWHDGFWFAAANVAGCILILPLCILDEETDGKVSTTAAHLTANGYSKVEIAKIMADQQKTMKALTAQKAMIKVLPQDTRESIAHDILTVNPKASQTYLDFVSESAGL
jgi:hypothetical protein